VNKFIAIFSLALLVTTGTNAADRSIATRVNAQIDFATKIDKCYAPIVFEEGIEPAALAKVKSAAEKRGWKLGSQSERVVNVENKRCKRS
jgi:hypothetical protein